MNKATSRYELIRLLRINFPKMWTKESEEFDGRENAIWTGEGSYVDDHNDMFNNMLDGGSYEMGIHKSLVRLLDEHGWFAEWSDGGTVFVYPNN